MGLADKIAEANKKKEYVDGETRDLDELGLPIFNDRPDYIAARILKKNYDEYSVGKVDLLHTRRNKKELWLGHELLQQDKKTLYRLAHTKQSIKDWMVPVIYEMLSRCCYELDESKIIVDEKHYWDKATGELKKIEGDMPAITPWGRS